jgi:hypothetical protein
MFDPTVYENLKVVLEGAVYDLDLGGSIHISAREDLIDLASMSRTYRLAFCLPPEFQAKRQVTAHITLSAGLADLAGEILEQEGIAPGCSLELAFTMALQPDEPEEKLCPWCEAAIRSVWGTRFSVRQTLSREYGREPEDNRMNRIRLLFDRKFAEDMAGDIPDLLEHVLQTAEMLSRGAEE